jgi:hypothetical protein
MAEVQPLSGCGRRYGAAKRVDDGTGAVPTGQDCREGYGLPCRVIDRGIYRLQVVHKPAQYAGLGHLLPILQEEYALWAE